MSINMIQYRTVFLFCYGTINFCYLWSAVGLAKNVKFDVGNLEIMFLSITTGNFPNVKLEHSALLSSCNYNEIFVNICLSILQNVYLHKKITLKIYILKKSK